MSSLNKILLVIAVIFALSLAGFVGYSKYQYTRFIGALAPHVKNTSLRISNSTSYEIDDEAKVTYKELFEKLESDIGEVDKHILDVQTISIPEMKKISEPTISYLKASQVYCRALLSKYRKSLAQRTAEEWAEKEYANFRSTSYYGYEYAERSALQAATAAAKARKEFKESTDELLDSVAKLKEARGLVTSLYADDSLISSNQLDDVIKKNSPQPDKAKSSIK